jgi:hypothetical protein
MLLEAMIVMKHAKIKKMKRIQIFIIILMFNNSCQKATDTIKEESAKEDIVSPQKDITSPKIFEENGKYVTGSPKVIVDPMAHYTVDNGRWRIDRQKMTEDEIIDHKRKMEQKFNQLKLKYEKELQEDLRRHRE